MEQKIEEVVVSPRFSFKGYELLIYVEENFGKIKNVITAIVTVVLLFNPAWDSYIKSGSFAALGAALSDFTLSAVQYWIKKRTKKVEIN